MRNLLPFPLIMATMLAVFGCASDGGSSHYSGDYIGPVYPSSGMYYGARDYYYYDDYPDYIVTPRPPVDAPDQPDNRPGLRPEHPIANPPGIRPGDRPGNRPSTLPAKRPSSASYQRARTPSIPTRARPSGGMRGGGMRGGGRRR
jgi:hypothetical protein